MVAVAISVTPRYGHFGGSAAGTPNFATSNSSGKVAKMQNRVRVTHPCMLCAVVAVALLFACIGGMLQPSPQPVARLAASVGAKENN
jgi:hypothetical protein